MRARLLAFVLGAALFSQVAVESAINDVALVNATECQVPDDSNLGTGAHPSDGQYPHQEWIGTDEAQAVVRALGEFMSSRFGTSSKRGNASQLDAGIVGVALDHEAEEYVVTADPTRVDTPSLERSLQQEAAHNSSKGVPPFDIRVNEACNSIHDLVRARQLIVRRTWHPDAQQAAFGFDVDPYTSTIEVSFDASWGDVGQALKQKLGDLVRIHYGTSTRLSRGSDGEPHHGAAGIRAGNESSNSCTSAFTVVLSNGNKGSVSAGHCYSNGQNIWSGSSEYYGVTEGKSDFPNYDMIRIAPNGETFTNKIHTDPCCPDVRTVTGHGPASVGELVCASGRVTRAICGLEVKSTSASVCDVYGCTPDLFTMRRASDVIGAQGDSGGPIYIRPSSSEARIRGMIVACDDGCKRLYAEKVDNIKSHLNVNVAQ